MPFKLSTVTRINISIMSCLCEMCGSSDIFAFDRSVRGIKEGIQKSAAGNFFVEIPLERDHGTNPSMIRKMISDTGTYFDTNGIPLLPFLNGRVGRITSLASITHQTKFPGSETICQLPSASFIKVFYRVRSNRILVRINYTPHSSKQHAMPHDLFQDLPLDVAVIFRFDKVR